MMDWSVSFETVQFVVISFQLSAIILMLSSIMRDS